MSPEKAEHKTFNKKNSTTIFLRMKLPNSNLKSLHFYSYLLQPSVDIFSKERQSAKVYHIFYEYLWIFKIKMI